MGIHGCLNDQQLWEHYEKVYTYITLGKKVSLSQQWPFSIQIHRDTTHFLKKTCFDYLMSSALPFSFLLGNL